MTEHATDIRPPAPPLDLHDIQSGAVHERPSPYVGTYLLVRVDEPAGGRELVERLLAVIDSAHESPLESAEGPWVTAAFTFEGLRALGVPQASLDSFDPEFRQGMASRATELGDVGDSGPEHWEAPLGSSDVHIAITVLSPDTARLEAALDRARRTYEGLHGVEVIWRQDCYQLPTGRTSFGFKDGIGQPAIEGSGVVPTNPNELPIKAGEFLLGYEDEMGGISPVPVPDELGRNGTYIVFRKLHTRVAAYRRYLKERSSTVEDEELLGAKMVGRWPSGAPLSLAPTADDPDVGGDPRRNNDFTYADDTRGLRCPLGAHARRANPRDTFDGEGGLNVRLHRMVRRSTSYGPMLPDGVLDDDGVDRGIVFVCAVAHLKRQYEFVKTQWINDGIFIGTSGERDPLVGPNDGSGTYTIPKQPIRRRLPDMPSFVVTRGGEYLFAPGLSGLRWLADLDT
jgi:Dyp-type peroxidase family